MREKTSSTAIRPPHNQKNDSKNNGKKSKSLILCRYKRHTVIKKNHTFTDKSKENTNIANKSSYSIDKGIDKIDNRIKSI